MENDEKAVDMNPTNPGRRRFAPELPSATEFLAAVEKLTGLDQVSDLLHPAAPAADQPKPRQQRSNSPGWEELSKFADFYVAQKDQGATDAEIGRRWGPLSRRTVRRRLDRYREEAKKRGETPKV